MENYDTSGYGWAAEKVVEVLLTDPVLRREATRVVSEFAGSPELGFEMGQFVWGAARVGLLWQSEDSQWELAGIGRADMEHVDYIAVAGAVAEAGTA